MAGYQEIRSRRGQLFYAPAKPYSIPYPSFVYFRPRVARPLILQVVHAPTDTPYLSADPPKATHRFLKVGKLANTRESAKRFFRFKSSTSTGLESASTAGSLTSHRSADIAETTSAAREMLLGEGGNNGNGRPNAAIGGPISGMLHRPTLADSIRTASTESSHSTSSRAGSAAPPIGDEKPIASGNGVSISIALAEPVLFLQGYDQHDTSNRTTAMLRGSFHLKVVKSAKIKTVTLKFRGRAETEWPEGVSWRFVCIAKTVTLTLPPGIPPKKTEFKDVESIMNHTWPFFNAQFETANQGPSGHGADYVKSLKGVTAMTKEIVPSLGISSSSFDHFQRSSRNGSDSLTSRDAKRLSLQLNHTRSFGKGDSSSSGPSIAQKGYRLFTPGDYIYSFELPIDSRMPETINVELGRVKYELEAIVERAGAFRANLVGTKEVFLIRTPAENSLETVEPIAISRDWEDQLHYDIVISGKSFPLGAQVPIAFKLTPLAKVQCHRIKVFVTENVQYYTSNRRVHRLEPTRKLHLFEKRADAPSTSAYPGSTVRITAGGGVAYDGREAAARGDESVQRDTTNLLGDLAGEHNVGPTEMEFNVQLPSCHAMKEKEKGARIHFDTTYYNIQVHHWIKVP